MPLIGLLAAVGAVAVVALFTYCVLPPVFAACALIWALGTDVAKASLSVSVAVSVAVLMWQAELNDKGEDMPRAFELAWFGGPIALAVILYPVGRARRRTGQKKTRTDNSVVHPARDNSSASKPQRKINEPPGAQVALPARSDLRWRAIDRNSIAEQVNRWRYR